MNFEQMATSLRQTPNFMQGTGATAAEIAEAEARLGPLPSDYKRFLSEFGWVHFGYDDIYGLGSELPYPEYSVLATTVRERESFGLPASLIAISNDGGGNLSCFKVAEFGQEPDGAVFVHYHENGDLIRKSNSFIDYVGDLLREYMLE
ncbi:hypothetical protein C1632_15070 [Microbacterium testaceum]|uniref:SMI1/KNR4 family protein n=1 Tax=Microbacterium testaceum TaxID=2033 RepID=UPI000CCE9C05|nr:SMI1/KNR4 family protein [Microbacterium testaceum]PNW08089.1 hypothetical protein C1632_15070 [Microbacterium testaceum]